MPLVGRRVDVVRSSLGRIEAGESPTPVEGRPGERDGQEACRCDCRDRHDVPAPVDPREEDEGREHRSQLDPGVPAECQHDDARSDGDAGHPEEPAAVRAEHRHRHADGRHHELERGVVADGRPAVEGDLAAAGRILDELPRSVARHDRDEDLCEAEAVAIGAKDGRPEREGVHQPDRQVAPVAEGGLRLVVDARCDAHQHCDRSESEQPRHAVRHPEPASAKALDEPGVREHEHGDVARRELSELLLRPPRRAVVGEAAVLDGKADARVGLRVEVDGAEEDQRRRRPPDEPADLHRLRDRHGGRRRRGRPLGDDAHRAAPPAASGVSSAVAVVVPRVPE